MKISERLQKLRIRCTEYDILLNLQVPTIETAGTDTSKPVLGPKTGIINHYATIPLAQRKYWNIVIATHGKDLIKESYMWIKELLINC